MFKSSTTMYFGVPKTIVFSIGFDCLCLKFFLDEKKLNTILILENMFLFALGHQIFGDPDEHGGPEVYTSLSLFLLFVIGFMESFDFKV